MTSCVQNPYRSLDLVRAPDPAVHTREKLLVEAVEHMYQRNIILLEEIDDSTINSALVRNENVVLYKRIAELERQLMVKNNKLVVTQQALAERSRIPVFITPRLRKEVKYGVASSTIM